MREESRPNVVWIFGDQHRAAALSCNGDSNVSTPNIDRLAATGVSFSQAVSGFPLCCPFRGSLLTSRYPHQCVPGHEYRLPEDQLTVAHAFRDAGYSTAYFGKWHLDGAHGEYETHVVPPDRRGGFDTWVGYENNNSQWKCIVHGGEGADAFSYRLSGYESDALTDLFIDHISSRPKGEPFFAALSVQPPHDPYVAPAEWMQRHRLADIELPPNVPPIPSVQERARRELAGYYAQIENLDWNVGRIISALDKNDLLLSTHIVFFSDHGDLHGSHGHFRKTSPYEESIRIPFIISGEDPAPYNRRGRRSGRVDVPINHVDIAPTTLGLCGIDPPNWMQGTDYSHYRLGARPVRDEPGSAFLQYVIPTGHKDGVERAWRGVVTRDGYKYVSLEGRPWLMFNLNEDPLELRNLAHYPAFGEERRRLEAELTTWIKKTGDDFVLWGPE